MQRTVAIGKQDFGEIIRQNCFYVDKTGFIEEWWENKDDVTLINRPRRFGKTLNMSMVDYFFSIKHFDDRNIFDGLKIFSTDKYRKLQGTYPLIFISFAKVKDTDIKGMKNSVSRIIFEEYLKHKYLLDGDLLNDNEKAYFNSIKPQMDSDEIGDTINFLSNFLYRYYGKKVIILLDEYDAPMQEAYVYGFWDEASVLFRSFFNATFKTNPYMERGLITGITRISKESIFSDLNNLEVVTTTSEKYETAFGFTEDEVFSAMDEYGLNDKAGMKQWYDGYVFGNKSDIYNPWSVINALDKKRYEPYWANTSSNSLLNNLMRQGDSELKMQTEELLKGNSITCFLDEDVIYNQLGTNKDAIWSLMLAAGYLRVEKLEFVGRLNRRKYTLKLTNMEVESMFNNMVRGWFKNDQGNYNGFIEALLSDNVKKMNTFINKVAINSFSYFDVGNKPSEDSEPERFYHGFVLGLVVELAEQYEVKSNRESGFGRYDIMLKPFDKNGKAYVFEFKVRDKDDEKTLEDTVKNALEQIEDRKYVQELLSAGIALENIRKYGFAFEGKKVLIG